MTDNVRKVLSGILQGFRDSVIGIFNVYKMDRSRNEEFEEDCNNLVRDTQTVLARRRAERSKTPTTAAKKESAPKIRQRIAQCCAFNGGVFGLSLLLFNFVVIPAIQSVLHLLLGGSDLFLVMWSYVNSTLSVCFSALWVLPLFLLSKICNFIWFQDVADAAYRKSRGRPQLPGFGMMIADSLFTVLLQSLFLLQAMLVRMLPIQGLGEVVYVLHLSLLYSLYSFEYKWFNMGWEVSKRLSYIECNWPYFIGFGLPLHGLTALTHSFIGSGIIFSIVFPLFIVSANEAEPPRVTFDFPLRLFAPVVSLSNIVFLRLKKQSATSVSGSTPSAAAVVSGITLSPKKVTK